MLFCSESPTSTAWVICYGSENSKICNEVFGGGMGFKAYEVVLYIKEVSIDNRIL